MSTEMDWSHDYCLSCDSQITEGAYCSQACRLADLEKAGPSDSTSPLSTSASSTASYRPQTATAHSHCGFHLPPALNFNSYSQQTQPAGSFAQQSSPTAYAYHSPPSPTSHTYYTSPQSKRLSASSSHSSLSSASGSQPNHITPQAASALQGYQSSFDQVRETKRRYRA